VLEQMVYVNLLSGVASIIAGKTLAHSSTVHSLSLLMATPRLQLDVILSSIIATIGQFVLFDMI